MNPSRKTSYWVVSAAIVLLMILLGFYFVPMTSVVHGESSKHEARMKKLVAKDYGVELLYQQPKVATREEMMAGRAALSQWLAADKATRNRLADDLVIGNTLLRRSREQLVAFLGPSEDNHPDRSASPPDGLFYDVTSDEEWCFLNVKLVDNRAVSVWLTVKYK